MSRARRARARGGGGGARRGSRASCTTSSRTRISVMVLQARGGRRMLAGEPERRARALDAIEHAGGQALGRDAPAARDAARRRRGARRSRRRRAWPARRARRPASRERACRSRSSIEGEPGELPPGVDALRVPDRPGGADERAQARRPGARRASRVRYAPDELELEVVDDGAGRGERRRRRPRPGRDARARRGLRRRARGRRAARRAGSRCGRGCRSSGAMIRVLLADDQGLVRAGFRMILDAEPRHRGRRRGRRRRRGGRARARELRPTSC